MIELPAADDAVLLADWVELSLAIEDQDSVSRLELSNLLEAELAAEPGEPFINQIFGELTRRHGLYTEPPFEVADGVVSRVEGVANRVEYRTMLALSLYGYRVGGGRGAKLFERLTAKAVERIYNASSYCFGWPVVDGLPAPIEGRVRQLAAITNERFVEAPGIDYKDRGVDVVFWTPHDSRPGQFVCLLQCAVGANWRTKTMGIPLASWKQYIHWANDPITALALPSFLSPESEWHDRSREAGIVLDRPRLLRGLSPPPDDAALNAAVREWLDGVIAEVSI